MKDDSEAVWGRVMATKRDQIVEKLCPGEPMFGDKWSVIHNRVWEACSEVFRLGLEAGRAQDQVKGRQS